MVKKGFTLIEMLVVITIIVITSLIAVPSLLAYSENAEQSVRTETAKSLYLAAQNQLTQLRALGNLKSAYGGAISGQYFLTDADGNYTNDLDPTKTSLNNVYTALGAANYPDEDEQNGIDNYIRYLSKPAGDEPSNPLQQLLAPAISNAQVLRGTIVLEYNILTGKVLSVFYSDLDEVTTFSYDSTDTTASGIYGPRSDLYDDIALQRTQGYYGVNYTGTTPPEPTVVMAIHMYDGYSDEGSDSFPFDPEAPPADYNYNKPLYNIDPLNTAASLENVLYAEILIEKSSLDGINLFDLSLGGTLVAEDIDFSDTTLFAEDQTFEDALDNFTANGDLLLYRNDDPVIGTIDSDFARFVWVFDYAGGDMSNENPERFKYSINAITDTLGAPLTFDANTNITATIAVNSGIVPPFESNAKNPYFATEYNAGGTPMNTAFENGIASARHLNNIRYTTAIGTTPGTDIHDYTQIQNIDFDRDDGALNYDHGVFDEEDAGDHLWNLRMAPLPELSGTYTARYDDSGVIGVYSLQDLHIYDINPSPDPATPAEYAGRSVALFETLTDDAVVSHLTFIDPLVEVKSTARVNNGGSPDAGKYSAVVAGFSTGSINHVTIISNNLDSPVVDIDDNTVQGDTDAFSGIRGDYSGGLVGMVGDTSEDDSIHHILYLARAPYEEIGSVSSNRVRFDFPIVGTNFDLNLTYSSTTGLWSDQINYDETILADRVIADSCYYLVGEQLRPDDDDNLVDTVINLNVDTVTQGLGTGISTNEIYADMFDATSDFYQKFMKEDPTDADADKVYSGVITADPMETTTSLSTHYPYPYYGTSTALPNEDKIDPTTNEMNFVWPIASLDPFTAEFVYFEVYGVNGTSGNIDVGYYQIDAAGDVLYDTLHDETSHRILSDGYAIKVNRPYSMLDFEDFELSVNGTALDIDGKDSWLDRYAERAQKDAFTEFFRDVDTDTTNDDDIESLFTISNSVFQSATNTAGDNDIITLSMTDGKTGTTPSTAYINPLFAQAIYTGTADRTEPYLVRSPRHLNNIGRYENSVSHTANFIQEVDIDFANLEGTFAYAAADWRYTSASLDRVYDKLKYDSGAAYIGGSGLNIQNSLVGVENAFTGTYDGNDKTIKNFTRSGSGDFALIGNNSGTIQDLTLDNINFSSIGLIDIATLVHDNYGTLQNITVQNSSVSASNYYWERGSDKGHSRPYNAGGVVAINHTGGVVNEVTVLNSSVYREHGATLANTGAGGIIGISRGTLTNSGVINSNVTAEDGFLGGLVGLADDGSSIEDSYFVYDNNDPTTGSPIYYVGSAIDNEAGNDLSAYQPHYSIGGIVGGIATGDTATVSDTLYLAPAPEIIATTGAPVVDPTTETADRIHPMAGSITTGTLTLSNNIYLTGEEYSSDAGVNWITLAYNTLPAYGAALNELQGFETSFINRAWLENFGNNQLEGWTQGTPYPFPTGAPTIASSDLPYTRIEDRPAQIESDSSGAVVLADVTAELLFDGHRSTTVRPNATVEMTLRLTNNTTFSLDIDDRFSEIQMIIGDYLEYFDLSGYEGGSAAVGAATIEFTNNGVAPAVEIDYTYDATDKSITLDRDDTDLDTAVIAPSGYVDFTITFVVRENLESDATISTDYYYGAASAKVIADLNATITADAADDTEFEFFSDKLYIDPLALLVATATPTGTANEDDFSFGFANASTTESQRGTLTVQIPAALTVDETTLTIDGVTDPLVDGTHYTFTTATSGNHTLKIFNFEVPESATDTGFDFTAENDGTITEATFDVFFTKTAFSAANTRPIAQSDCIFTATMPVSP